MAALGRGYTVVSQEIRVDFQPSPEPVIRINARYQLRNTGNQPLASLEVRLPGRRRFHFTEPKAFWDSTPLMFENSPFNPRDTQFALPRPWAVSASHSLRLSVELQAPHGDESTLSFTPDAFFLPAQGWSPELLPARGIFATGGVPPKSWNLVVNVPADFSLHLSGEPSRRRGKTLRKSGQQTVTAVQHHTDGYPFVIAGRYKTAQEISGGETVNLWTRSSQGSDALQQPARAVVQTIRAYDVMFGARARESHQLWIVECPSLPGCFTRTASSYASLVFDGTEGSSAEMVSTDTVMVDLTAGAPAIAAAVAPSLASSWLGYGPNPGFLEQVHPLSALPAFAAARGREAVAGPQLRTELIRRALQFVPPRLAGQPENEAALRAKSFLFFYALQDRYGSDVFDRAVSHMLYARRGGGFDLADLIAAFEQEAHQNVAEFVRVWMKHPGVPDEFRERYEHSSAVLTLPIKETAA